jgi:hypothetical protein
MEFTLSIMSGGVTTLDYPIRKEYLGVQLVLSGAGLFLDHPLCHLAGSNTNMPGLCLISFTI